LEALAHAAIDPGVVQLSPQVAQMSTILKHASGPAVIVGI